MITWDPETEVVSVAFAFPGGPISSKRYHYLRGGRIGLRSLTSLIFHIVIRLHLPLFAFSFPISVTEPAEGERIPVFGRCKASAIPYYIYHIC